jgi:hypothetical protein
MCEENTNNHLIALDSFRSTDENVDIRHETRQDEFRHYYRRNRNRTQDAAGLHSWQNIEHEFSN